MIGSFDYSPNDTAAEVHNKDAQHLIIYSITHGLSFHISLPIQLKLLK